MSPPNEIDRGADNTTVGADFACEQLTGPRANEAAGDDRRNAVGSERRTVVIVVEPIGHGRFRARIGHRGRYRARLDGRVIVASSSTPLLDAARALIAEGCDPSTLLEMRRPGAASWDVRSPIGVAARLDVTDARFVKHHPPAEGVQTADASPAHASESRTALRAPPRTLIEASTDWDEVANFIRGRQ